MICVLVLLSLVITAVTNPCFADVVERAPTKDASVYENHPSSNYGTFPELDWGRSSGGNVYAFLVFSGLSGYSGVTLNSATLSVCLVQSWNFDDNRLRRVIEDWDENSVTWNNQPDNTTQGELEFTAFPIEWFDLDVTTTVQDWLDGTYPNYGFCFLRIDSFDEVWSLYSRNYSDPDYHPKLNPGFPLAGGVHQPGRGQSGV